MAMIEYNDSASEGEIIESDGGEIKATTTRPRAKDQEIDRNDRPRSLVSRSARPPQLDGTDERNGHYHDSDHRNGRRGPSDRRPNSPLSDSRAQHGQKRRRDDRGYHDRENNDTRRFKVHYEGGDERSYQSGRGREEHRDQRGGRAERYSNGRHGEEPRGQAGRDHDDRPSTVTKEPASRQISKEVEEETAMEDAPPVDEATQIEERRRRREALRAKHKGHGNSLLQQALDTPSPGTPQADSAPSPTTFSVDSDQELVNPIPQDQAPDDGNHGPSAADYDPSMDMQETKLREQRLSEAQATAAAGDVLHTHQNDDSAKADVSAVRPKTKEFDMFGDDEEEDMFAPEDDANKGHKKDDGTQAVRIPEAKQLDRSLLDDWDDPEGYYRIILGELLDGRYHVQTNLGKGVFSAVVRALDTKTNTLVAIKVIRKQESMYKAGMQEIETLQKLIEADPEDKKHVIRLERHFEHKGHLCMVFENLADNLREILKKFGRDVGINIKAVRSYAQQMFLGLSLLKKCEILHADLKPDNVLVNESRSHLKIADLGSAIDARDNDITDTLVSRFYRAPEIMLGMRYDYAIDMWSIGCTLFELYTGKILFTGSTNNQMLKGIIECRGKIPNRMLKRSEYWSQHFDPSGTFLSQEFDNVTRKEVLRRMDLTKTVQTKELRSRLFANAKGMSPADAKELMVFADLLDKCLAVDPVRRISPNEALKHGFISRAAATKA